MKQIKKGQSRVKDFGKLNLTGFKQLNELNPSFIQCEDIMIIDGKRYKVIETQTNFMTEKFLMTLESI